MILKKLFEPIVIKGLHVSNRVVMPPMHSNMGNMDDGITEEAIDFFSARAKGGFGMIGVGVIDTYFFPGASSPFAFFLMNDRHIEKHRRAVKEIKKYGAVVYAQLSIRRVFPVQELHRLPKLSNVPEAQIPEMMDSMVQTAVRVREAGYDAVSILGMGGSAIMIFLSQVLNDRTDQWGGSFENRLRFPIETVKGIRKALGEDYPVFFRLQGSELLPGGYGIDTAKEIAQHLKKAGVDFFNVGGGSHGASVPQLTPNVPGGTYAMFAREIRQATKMPVSASIRINHPLIAERLLQKGWSDMVSVARGAISDAEWVNKARQGEFSSIRSCIACNECLDAVVIREKPLCCTVNPRVGAISEIKALPMTGSKKRVLVVGGGCVGLQAALTCAERGHKVTLVEKEVVLGGRWRLAAIPSGREELLTFFHWLFRQVREMRVEIRLGTEATPELVKEVAPDAVILCTGGRPRIPDVPGTDLPNVYLAQQVLDSMVEVGDKVVVIGAGGVGVETALFLAKRWSSSPESISFLLEYQALEKEEAASLRTKGHQVVLCRARATGQLDKIGRGLGPGTKWVLVKELEMANVQTMPDWTVKEIRKDGVVVGKDGSEKFIEADTVVLATGFTWDDTLRKHIESSVPMVYTAGIASTSDHLISGIREAFDIAMKM